mmetsp:Transcript_12763/g.38636  ORF Transcript_12763/g.38636 Transcript_12763/m.38636 type:complete len:728 (+) Transcript_12763:217-2400(+)
MAAFEELGVMPEIIRAIDELGWLLPRPVQTETIPLVLGGGDVLAAAETGSGKTGAFALPVLQIAHEISSNVAMLPSSSRAAVSQEKVIGMNVADRDRSLAIAPDHLLCQTRDQQAWAGARSCFGVAKGKYYYEVTVTDEGLGRVGFSTQNASLNLGTDAFGFGYGGTAKKAHKGKFTDYGEKYGLDDTIGCLLDLNAWTISFTHNGIEQGIAFQIPKGLQGEALFPAIVLKNAEVRVNFGESQFCHPPPAGYDSFKEASASDIRFPVVRERPTASRPPVVLILEPTRELASQTHKELGQFSRYLKDPSLDLLLITGGQSQDATLSAVRAGLDVVTATPGRLLDMVEANQLDLSFIRFFVLDEADELLNSGNFGTITKLFGRMPKTCALQVLMFSATLHSPEVKKLANIMTQFPTWVDLKGRDTIPETVAHCYYMVNPRLDQSWIACKPLPATDGVHGNDHVNPSLSSPEALSEGIKRLKPLLCKQIIDHYEMDQCLIFARTRLDCDNLQKYFRAVSTGLNYSCVTLHSGKGSRGRDENYAKFKSGEVQLLICTDVAARGLDVSGLPFVINYTLPSEPATYLHRIGRVGRADHLGLAISLVGCAPEKVWFHTCKQRGSGCTNRKLVKQGGCCIWFDELEMVRQIEAHVDAPLPQSDENFEVPPLVPGVRYGERIDSKTIESLQRCGSSSFEEHRQYLSAAVSDLAHMEETLQTSYLSLKLRWQHKAAM